MASDDPAMLHIEVVISPGAGEVRQISLTLHAGSSVRDALSQSGLSTRIGDAEVPSMKVGVWGQLKSLDHPLRDRDRVEIYRPLMIDPKDARRRRQRATCSPKRSRP